MEDPLQGRGDGADGFSRRLVNVRAIPDEIERLGIREVDFGGAPVHDAALRLLDSLGVTPLNYTRVESRTDGRTFRGRPESFYRDRVAEVRKQLRAQGVKDMTPGRER